MQSLGRLRLRAAWREHGAQSREQHGISEREHSLTGIRADIDGFLAGEMDLEDFKRSIDGRSKKEPHFGFRASE